MQLLHTTRPQVSNRSDRAAQWPPVASLIAQPFTIEAAPASTKEAVGNRWRFDQVANQERGSTESFIAAQFLKAYGAHITEFMPELMGLYDGSAMAAACGLRGAITGPMFLEQYLDRPAESVLCAMTGLQIKRRSIVEVGNLSISRPGYARHLVYWLTKHLRSTGMQWAVFSAVPALRNNFLRLGIPLFTLGQASPDKLPAETKAAWGTYYDQKPQVTAVSVESAFEALSGLSCNP